MGIFTNETLLVRYRFWVTFLLPYPVDMGFQKVSGLRATTKVDNIQQGGDNDAMYNSSSTVTYDNLVLESGRRRGNINSLMEMYNNFSSTFNLSFTPPPVDILITAINPQGGAMSSWVIRKACPVSWSTSDLDANSNDVIIDTLELSYKTLKSITL